MQLRLLTEPSCRRSSFYFLSETLSCLVRKDWSVAIGSNSELHGRVVSLSLYLSLLGMGFRNDRFTFYGNCIALTIHTSANFR